MNRLIIVARLREGAHDEAEALLKKGPPFEPEEHGFHRHAAYLTAGEVVFIFEAPDVEWVVNDLADEVLMSTALDQWRNVVDGAPRIAHERFNWTRAGDKLGVGLGV
jgi:hypothetical protein